ncbi:LDL receptor repeat-containing protein egg-2-like [Pomacea canaliculata]|uniref:LDL receptor repeat-containing protein egg-2-like n=1 Tax=Pomacea canaliculata TaxID=400727 RepID=UPI000D73DED7|nr:LDL receptor repeat-containing protein egg-2-like [Pomacea canaliculata]
MTLLDDANVTLFSGFPHQLPTIFITYSHLMTFHLTFDKTQLIGRYGFTMIMNITTLPESSRPQFQIVFNSSTSAKQNVDAGKVMAHSSKEYFRLTICQLSKTAKEQRGVQLPVIFTNGPHDRLSKAAYIRCPANHFTHVFLACDDVSSCWSNKSGATPSCSAPLTPLPPSFKCGGEDSVPYTLVCDHQPDCKDESDEDFCVFEPCDSPLFVFCSGRRCVHYRNVCDDKADCDDYADEILCHISSLEANVISFDKLISTSARLEYREGLLVLTNHNMSEASTFSCPVSHFMCASLHQVCLPVFLRCNGLYDCPDHEDEAECDR